MMKGDEFEELYVQGDTLPFKAYSRVPPFKQLMKAWEMKKRRIKRTELKALNELKNVQKPKRVRISQRSDTRF